MEAASERQKLIVYDMLSLLPSTQHCPSRHKLKGQRRESRSRPPPSSFRCCGKVSDAGFPKSTLHAARGRACAHILFHPSLVSSLSRISCQRPPCDRTSPSAVSFFSPTGLPLSGSNWFRRIGQDDKGPRTARGHALAVPFRAQCVRIGAGSMSARLILRPRGLSPL